ncbi:TetR/AcrR family transcriptional regulator [[Eubacterium] cellulosolvens]
MIRITKDPDERREELVNIAEELFLKYGYEETPVSDVVKKAKVAQGTFYYYFKSKDEILDAIIDRYLNEIVTIIKKQVNRKDIGAVDKILQIIRGSLSFGQTKERLVDYFHEEKNVHLHFKMEQKIYPILANPIRKIIEQGISEKVFDTKYPYETALLLLGTNHTIFNLEAFFEKGPKEQKRILEAGFYLVERMLGAKQNTFLKRFLKLEGIK